ncbi:hypothetical protein CYMTET_31372 [Cymbomonas tetramitiformis]|uniref:Protein kinase domain-containing protein n=1 Tax=Cymbomonas tetramitiformis TaxID=36881 RepID=A0AAE0FH59_9CHLO|nr:hypothetical protein CYMTET_31372 [Cymbomonas tetramitiformis]
MREAVGDQRSFRRPAESVPAAAACCATARRRLGMCRHLRLPITQAECRGITVRVRNPTSRHQLAANMRQLPESTAEGEAPGGAERCEPDENSGGRARPRSLSRLQERGEELQARISRIAGALTRVSQEEDATRAQAAALLTELQDLLHSVAAIEIELEGGGETCGEKEGEAREASGEHSGARLEDLCGRIARARAQSRSLSSAMEQWVDLGEAGEPAEQRRHVAQELRDVAGRIEVAAAELAKRRGQKSGDRAHEESEALPQELQELPALDERGGADDASPAASTCSDQNAAEGQAAAEAIKEEIKTGGGGTPASSGVSFGGGPALPPFAPPVAAGAGAESPVASASSSPAPVNAAEGQAAAEAIKEEIKTGGGGTPASSGLSFGGGPALAPFAPPVAAVAYRLVVDLAVPLELQAVRAEVFAVCSELEALRAEASVAGLDLQAVQVESSVAVSELQAVEVEGSAVGSELQAAQAEALAVVSELQSSASGEAQRWFRSWNGASGNLMGLAVGLELQAVQAEALAVGLAVGLELQAVRAEALGLEALRCSMRQPLPVPERRPLAVLLHLNLLFSLRAEFVRVFPACDAGGGSGNSSAADHCTFFESLSSEYRLLRRQRGSASASQADPSGTSASLAALTALLEHTVQLRHTNLEPAQQAVRWPQEVAGEARASYLGRQKAVRAALAEDPALGRTGSNGSDNNVIMDDGPLWNAIALRDHGRVKYVEFLGECLQRYEGAPAVNWAGALEENTGTQSDALAGGDGGYGACGGRVSMRLAECRMSGHVAVQLTECRMSGHVAVQLTECRMSGHVAVQLTECRMSSHVAVQLTEMPLKPAGRQRLREWLQLLGRTAEALEAALQSPAHPAAVLPEGAQEPGGEAVARPRYPWANEAGTQSNEVETRSAAEKEAGEGTAESAGMCPPPASVAEEVRSALQMVAEWRRRLENAEACTDRGACDMRRALIGLGNLFTEEETESPGEMVKRPAETAAALQAAIAEEQRIRGATEPWATALQQAGPKLAGVLRGEEKKTRRVLAELEELEQERRALQEAVRLGGDSGELRKSEKNLLDAKGRLEDLDYDFKKSSDEHAYHRRKRADPETMAFLKEKMDADREAMGAGQACVRLALSTLIAHQAHFPEVLRFFYAGMPPQLAPLWDPVMRLGDFDDHRLVSGEGRHEVYRATKGGICYAVKVFKVPVLEPERLKTFWREAALLQRLEHPAIVPIRKMFSAWPNENGTHYLALKLPYYKCGHLGAWVRRECPKGAHLP